MSVTQAPQSHRLFGRLATGIGLVLALVIVAGIALVGTTGRLFTIETGSMSPTIPPGSEVYVKHRASYQPGQVISFRANDFGRVRVVTHRLIGYNPDGSFITKGDANRTADVWSRKVEPGDVIGQVVFAPKHVGWYVDLNYWKFKLHQPRFRLGLGILVLSFFVTLITLSTSSSETSSKNDSDHDDTSSSEPTAAVT